MHPNNLHKTAYNFKELTKVYPKLANSIFINNYGITTIDFSDNETVFHLNKALLKLHYHVDDWSLPKNYLCPAIPSRVDYIHYISDLLSESNIKKCISGLDIGTGANCIYPILASQIYRWNMVGVDIDKTAVDFARRNTKNFDKIKIRQQEDRSNIFKEIIKENEFYHFTMCNPPFFSSQEEAKKTNLKKRKKLQNNALKLTLKDPSFNFGGQSHELWCNGGEALFIKRMIKQSVVFKNQVLWFTCLVSKKDHLPKIYKQLTKLQATHKTVEMTQGNKKSRFIAWKF